MTSTRVASKGTAKRAAFRAKTRCPVGESERRPRVSSVFRCLVATLIASTWASSHSKAETAVKRTVWQRDAVVAGVENRLLDFR